MKKKNWTVYMAIITLSPHFHLFKSKNYNSNVELLKFLYFVYTGGIWELLNIKARANLLEAWFCSNPGIMANIALYFKLSSGPSFSC